MLIDKLDSYVNEHPDHIVIVFDLDESCRGAFDNWILKQTDRQLQVGETIVFGGSRFTPGMYRLIRWEGYVNPYDGEPPFEAVVVYGRDDGQNALNPLSLNDLLVPRLPANSTARSIWFLLTPAEEEIADQQYRDHQASVLP
jgi:hypothetical protein